MRRERDGRARSWCCPSTASPRSSRPIHINRALREAGWLRVREELGRELLDAGASEPSPWPIIRSRTSTWRDPSSYAEVAQSAAKRSPASSGCSTTKASARSAWIIRAPASWLRSPTRDSWFTYYYFLDDDRGARLRAHRRHSSQAGLRPGRAVRRPGTAGAETADRGPFGPEEAWHALSDGRNIARRNACAGLPRPPDRPGRGWPTIHNLHA